MNIRKLLYTLLSFFALLFWLHNGQGNAGTVNAVSTSYSDVAVAVASASPGDTVVVPSGVAAWSTTLTIDKGIRLQGAGIDNTVVTASGIPAIITISTSGDHAIDISGFTLDAYGNNSVINIFNASNTVPIYNLRIHHNKLKNASSYAVRPWGLIFGLIDNNEFVANKKDFDPMGKDSAWSLFPGKNNLGSEHYLYIEDNSFTQTGDMGIEGGEATRWVYRYNTFDGSKVGSGGLWLDFHGDTRNRGGVACEIYENTVSGYQFKGIDLRGGTAIVFNNHINMAGGSYEGRVEIREEYGNTVTPCDIPGNCYSDNCGDVVNNTYIWNNHNDLAGNAITIAVSDCCSCLSEDSNWWDDYKDSNFTKGLSSSRVGICSNNDSYWETDTRMLYRCVGENNWTYIYSPYAYPHPLRVRPVEQLGTPKNLRVQ